MDDYTLVYFWQLVKNLIYFYIRKIKTTCLILHDSLARLENVFPIIILYRYKNGMNDKSLTYSEYMIIEYIYEYRFLPSEDLLKIFSRVCLLVSNILFLQSVWMKV